MITQNLLKCPKDPFVRSALICSNWWIRFFTILLFSFLSRAMAQYGLFSPYEVMNFCLHSIYSFNFITVSSGRFTQGFTVFILILFTLKTSGDSDQQIRHQLIWIYCLQWFLCLFGLIFYTLVNNFSVMLGWVFLGLTSNKQRTKCLAQGLSEVPPVRLEPATPPSPVKHSLTEPPRSSYTVLKSVECCKVISKALLLSWIGYKEMFLC